MHPALEGTGIPDVDATLAAPLAPWTSVRVGGPAELLVRPKSSEQLVRLLERVRALKLPLTLLGGGANTLVSDAGVPGVMVKLPAGPEEIEPIPDGRLRVTLSAGTPITRLVTLMRKHKKVGAEFLAGIPGTLGGATRMNAGTKQGECCSLIESVEIATADGLEWRPPSALKPAYRHTELPIGAVLTRIRFVLLSGDLEASKLAMDSDLAYRKRTQPLSEPNFGSVFANPPGDHAGRLLETAGLKGLRAGGAQVSPLHANWIVNLGGATARDIVSLMDQMRSRVQTQFAVSLKAEVQYVGVF